MYFAVTLLMMAPVLTAGCGGPVDPPGTVPPNEGNLSSESIAGDDAATSSSASSSGAGRTTPPKWSEIFSAYLNTGTIGNCVICHSEMRTASGAYSYLQSTDYISGTSSILAKTGSSCLSWFGGNMPPGGTRSNATAISDVNAWAAAGAMNN
jgi:hypothetical protein